MFAENEPELPEAIGPLRPARDGRRGRERVVVVLQLQAVVEDVGEQDEPDFGLAAAAGLAALLIGSRRRRPPAGPPRAYRRALSLLARRGLRRDPATTARGFVSELAGQLPGDAHARFARITDAYLAERFGEQPSATTEPRALADLAELESLLRRRAAAQSAP